MNMLIIAKFVVVAVSIGLFIIALIYLLTNQTKRIFIRSIIFSPAMLIYLGLTILFVYFSKDNLVGLWDELRLWGAYPKALYTTSSLQLGNDAMIYPIMQSYPPAMPLLGYFFTKFSNTFNESVLFFVYSFLGLALLLPFTKYLKWSKWYNILFFAFIIVFMPHLVYILDFDYAYYYQSLFIDCTLGIAFGYSIIKAKDSAYKDNFETYSFFVLLFCLSLLKDSGIFFAFVALLVSIINYFKFKESKKVKSFILRASISGIAILFAYLSWHLTLSRYNITNHIKLSGTTSLLSVLKFLVKIIVGNKVYLAVILVAVVSLIVYKYILYRMDPSERKTKLWFAIIQITSYVVFVLGYLAIFANRIIEVQLPSITRYMGTLVVCELYCLISILIEKYKNKDFYEYISSLVKSNRSRAKYIAAISMSCILLIASILLINNFRKYDSGVYAEASQIEEHIVSQVEGNDDEMQNIFYITQGDVGSAAILHHRLYFNLIDHNIRIANFYSEINVLHLTHSEFLDLLITMDIDYIYIHDSSDEFVNLFGDLFSDYLSPDSCDLIFELDSESLDIKY
ncbi:MAG: hypothetical protein JXN65_06055 [Clostridia bacterium]|nr:hypothetical protein [Clostridia bacterium]